MKKHHKKLCKGCFKEFEGSATGNCPHCGSTVWIFLNGERERKYETNVRHRRES